MNWRTVKSTKGVDKYQIYFQKLSKAAKKRIHDEMYEALQAYRQQELFEGKSKTLEMEAADKSASLVLRVPRGRRPRRPKYS